MADVALVLTGGGARAAYQVGLLRCIAMMAPEYRFRLLSGVSAGAINAAFLASRAHGVAHASEELCRLWSALEVESVFRTDALAMIRCVLLWAVRLTSGGSRIAPDARGLIGRGTAGEPARA
jgi:NTE family protein